MKCYILRLSIASKWRVIPYATIGLHCRYYCCFKWCSLGVACRVASRRCCIRWVGAHVSPRRTPLLDIRRGYRGRASLLGDQLRAPRNSSRRVPRAPDALLFSAELNCNAPRTKCIAQINSTSLGIVSRSRSLLTPIASNKVRHVLPLYAVLISLPLCCFLSLHSVSI